MLSPTKKRRVASSTSGDPPAGAPAAHAPAPPAVAVAAPNAASGGYQVAGNSIPHVHRMSISPSKNSCGGHSPASSNPYRDTTNAPDSTTSNIGRGEGASASEIPTNDCTMMEEDEGDDYNDFDLSQAVEMAAVTAAMASLDICGGGSSASASASTPGQQEERQKGDEMQEKAISLAESGANIFLTGRAGTGKSWTTKQIVHTLQLGKYVGDTGNSEGRKQWKRGKVVHVTAPTGMSAINISGTTIHRWGGFGKGEYYSDFDKMFSKKNRERICGTDVLVLDEVSMVSGHLFDTLECMVAIIRSYKSIKEVLKKLKENAPKSNSTSTSSTTMSMEAPVGEAGSDREGGVSININRHVLDMRWKDESDGGLGNIRPWGGLQLILIGDFAQLPPIPNKSGGDSDVSSDVIDEVLVDDEVFAKVGRQGTYAFQSRAWSRSELNVVELVKVHRQVQDDGLLKFLNDLREGKADLAATHRGVISSLCAPLPRRDDGIIPTELYSKNAEVDRKNQEELAKLQTEGRGYTSKDGIQLHERYKTRLLEKHGLDKVAHMPYLWSSVEPLIYPQAYKDAKEEISSLEAMKKKLLDEEKYEEIISFRDRLNELKEKVVDTETEYECASIITPDTINLWLEKNPDALQIGNGNEIFSKIEVFWKELTEDYGDFNKHAQERFFQKECRVAKELELKIKAQVMLLWNLSIKLQLVNGSRGIIVGFLEAREYKRMIQDELDHRKRAKTGNSGDKQESNHVDSLPASIKSLTLTTELSETQITALRSRLLSCFTLPLSPPPTQHDYATDLLDYVLAMLTNGKELGYIVEEMVGMELEICDKTAGERVEQELAAFFMNGFATKATQTSNGRSQDSYHERRRYRPVSSSLDSEAIDGIMSQIELEREETLENELKKLDDIGTSFREFPYVRFDSASKLILPTPFGKEFRGFFTATRWQLPLTHAWALSIHKSQGMVREYIILHMYVVDSSTHYFFLHFNNS